MTDDKHHRDARSFDGQRFLKENELNTNQHGFASQSESWLLFGSGRITWYVLLWLAKLCISNINSPGRFFSAVVMKLTFAHMLSQYDCKIDVPVSGISLSWRNASLPRDAITLQVKHRI
jgi:uncharacterized membrane protein YiaA